MERIRLAAIATLLGGSNAPATAQNLIVDPNFSSDVGAWTGDAGTNIVFDGNQDANGSVASGAMAMLPTSGFTVSAHQCLVIAGGSNYSFGAQVKPNTVISFGMTCSAFPTADCGSGPISSVSAIIAGPPGQGGWVQLRTESPFSLPVATQSVSCAIIGGLQPPAEAQEPNGAATSMWADNVFFALGTTPVMLQAFQIE
jgi:hypothetical protein